MNIPAGVYMPGVRILFRGRCRKIMFPECWWDDVERRLNDCAGFHTAFSTFDALLDAPRYWPSIYVGGKCPGHVAELVFLTVFYNFCQMSRRDLRRAHCADFELRGLIFPEDGGVK